MSNKLITSIVVAVTVVVVGVFIYQKFFGERFSIPENGETTTESITLEEEVNQIINEEMKEETSLGTKEIQITDGVRHSVPLSEIVGGGPPKDGIPPIDDPKFITPQAAAQWLNGDEPGISFSDGEVHRFYPYQILVWHEIVNDTINDKRVLVTYCPLCLTGSVFDPVVDGERVEFGTSGLLWQSNLVMYDRKTDSLWSQVLGESIMGEKTGSKLKLLSSDQIKFDSWKKLYPNGEVLSRDTGATRFYGSNPYGDYFSVTSFATQMVGNKDARLPSDVFIYGILVNGKAKAYNIESVKEKGSVEDVFEGVTIVLNYEKDLDVVRIFRKKSDGALERINPFSAFWFSWAAVHPETELYK